MKFFWKNWKKIIEKNFVKIGKSFKRKYLKEILEKKFVEKKFGEKKFEKNFCHQRYFSTSK